MNIETNSSGSHLPKKPYYPLYLGNGVDGMLINILGSGDCWFETTTDYSAPLSALKAPGWYKSDRRTKTGIDLIYGILFPLFEFSSCPVLNGDLAVPRTSRQFFDPTKATLTTHYEQLDNETHEWMKVKVTTFLTNEHVLVEHYEFEETPASGVSMVFFLNSPSDACLHLYPRVVTMDRAVLKAEAEKSRLEYEYAFEGFQGGALSWFDCKAELGFEGGKPEEVFLHGKLQTRPLHKGESFTRYLAAIDNEDAKDYRAALEATITECRSLGYRAIKERHEASWNSYFKTASVTIPDSIVPYFYDVSRYMCRANLHPNGHLPMGNISYQWQGVMFWDAGFVIQALTGCGNLPEAQKALDHIRDFQANGRALAQAAGGRGMRMEWTTEHAGGFTTYPSITMQVHNNGWWAHTIYSYYEATGDLKFLERNFEVMGELLLFLTDSFVEDRGDHAIVKRCSGPDESVSHPKTNDTWTNAVMLKGLIEYIEAADILKKPPMIEGLDGLIKKLAAGLEKNVDENGVMQSFQGGSLPHWGSLVFDLFPDHPALKPTLRKMMENYDAAMDLYNFMGVTRYAAMGMPWPQYWAARCFALVGDSTAHHLLMNALESANYFGGMPERVFIHGELYVNWFLTAHGAMAWAVNGMLANARKNVLRILGGTQQSWKNVSFNGIHAGDGLVVSAEIRNGEIERLTICNLLQRGREVKLLVGGQKRGRKLHLQPGVNEILGEAAPPIPAEV